MSKENVKKFFELANNDKNLQNEIRDILSNINQKNLNADSIKLALNKLQKLSISYNLPFTISEYFEFSKDLYEKLKLSGEDLDLINGGSLASEAKNIAIDIAALFMIPVIGIMDGYKFLKSKITGEDDKNYKMKDW